MKKPAFPEILGNIYELPGESWPDEIFEIAAKGAGIRVERILSCGQATPPGQWYDQDNDEWVLLVKGSAVLRFEDGAIIELNSGDHMLIPRKCRHRVEHTSSPCIWIAVHAGLNPNRNDSETRCAPGAF